MNLVTSWQNLYRLVRPRTTSPQRGLKVARLTRAKSLDPAWDTLATSLFQRRDFLTYLEQYNPCQQRYYELRDAQNQLIAGAVVYTLRLDLLTFVSIRSPWPMNFIGIPCSQSMPGLIGEHEPAQQLLLRIQLEEPRFLVGLNLDYSVAHERIVEGRNLPTVVLEPNFASLEAYLASLRSAYRRRFKRDFDRLRQMHIERSSCARFDAEMYALYLDVYARCNTKLEKLSHAFFKNLPEAFVLSSLHVGDQLQAWSICVADGERWVFFMGGHPPHAHTADLYRMLLLDVLVQAFASACRSIDLGQTAEIPKTRLGGKVQEKYLFALHPRYSVRRALKLADFLFTYRRQVPATRVFRT